MNCTQTKTRADICCPWHQLGHIYPTLSSTMVEAQKLAAGGAPHGTWVLAHAQTAGRGRLGRRWQSAPHAGVYWTLLLRPQAGAPLQGLSLVFGMAAFDAIMMVLQAHAIAPSQVPLGLKWPNDIVCQGRKLGGILIEAEGLGGPRPVLRVGIGLNVKAARCLTLPADVAPRYIGLMQLAEAFGAATPRASMPAEAWIATLTHALVACCYASYRRLCTTGLEACLKDFTARDALRGRRVTACVGHRLVVGVADGIGADGRLRLRLGDQTVWVDSGEVAVQSANSQLCPVPTNITQQGPAVYVGLTPEAP